MMTYRARRGLQSLPHRVKHCLLAFIEQRHCSVEDLTLLCQTICQRVQHQPGQVVQRRLMHWHWHAFTVARLRSTYSMSRWT